MALLYLLKKLLQPLLVVGYIFVLMMNLTGFYESWDYFYLTSNIYY